MDEDLGMFIGNRYSLVSMIFFVPYVIFQFPANIAIRKLGAALWLSCLVVLWGCVSIGMGFSKEWTQLLGCRVILGVLEAGYYPVKSQEHLSKGVLLIDTFLGVYLSPIVLVLSV